MKKELSLEEDKKKKLDDSSAKQELSSFDQHRTYVLVKVVPVAVHRQAFQED